MRVPQKSKRKTRLQSGDDGQDMFYYNDDNDTEEVLDLTNYRDTLRTSDKQSDYDNYY